MMRSATRTVRSRNHRSRVAATSIVLAALWSGVASADPTVTVELEVEAQPRTITVGSGPDPSFAIMAFQGGVVAGAPGNPSATTSLSFSNPEGNGNARIMVSRDSTDLGGLQLFATMQAPGGEYPYEILTAARWTGVETDSQTIADTITATSDFGTSVRWTLGTAPMGDTGAPRTMSTTFTFTIVDDVED